MNDMIKTPPSPTTPIVPDGHACAVCGEPIHSPRENAALLVSMYDEINADLRARTECVRGAGADEITIVALQREVIELWCRSVMFPTLRKVASELLGAHAACIVKATSGPTRGAS